MRSIDPYDGAMSNDTAWKCNDDCGRTGCTRSFKTLLGLDNHIRAALAKAAK